MRGEKRGNTISIRYSFDTARSLEVNYAEDKWARVSPNEFRSFGGRRRILNVDDPSKAFYEEYEGPVYSFGTNFLLSEEDIVPGLNYPHNIDPRKLIQEKADKLYTKVSNRL